MNQVLDPLNLLFLAIAAFIIWRLYSVLGTRTGNEKAPFDPFAAKRARDVAPPIAATEKRTAAPADIASAEKTAEDAAVPVWKGFAAEGSPVAEVLERLAKSDRNFSPKSFLDGAKLAYEMIIEAFAKGDRAALKPLLTRDVFDGFSQEIDTRNGAGQKLETQFVGISRAEISAAELTGTRASITVKLVSQMISATLSRAGDVIDGNPKEVREITDVWTFERDVGSRDPNWKLAATEDAA